MKNVFRTVGDNVFIEVFCKDKRMETVISKEDFEKVDSHNGKWYAWYSKDNDSYYVCGWKQDKGDKVKTFYLHRFLLNAEKGKLVDHKNHNTLDNTRGNIKVVTASENQSNRKKFGGVAIDRYTGKYRARFKHLKVLYDLGRFDTYEEAKEAVIIKKKELKGEW